MSLLSWSMQYLQCLMKLRPSHARAGDKALLCMRRHRSSVAGALRGLVQLCLLLLA